jgi:RNA polymerase sporulation-specific sigma factor
VQELAQTLDTSPEQVSEALCAARPVLSLSVEGEDRRPFEIPVESKEEEICDHQALHQSLARLPQPDQELIRLRYFENKTQTLTAKALGMTQVQVSRRERVLLQQLRAGMI